MELETRTDRYSLAPGTKHLVVLGDPHGDVPALEGVLRRESREGTEVVSVGDNVGYKDGPASSELCSILEKRGIRSVYGNHEHWMRTDGRLFLTHPPEAPDFLSKEALSFCQKLPLRLHIEIPGHPELLVGVIHAMLEEEWEYVDHLTAPLVARREGLPLIFCGHSHRPAIYVLPGAGHADVLKLDPESDEPIEIPVEPGARYVVDAGSISRPDRGKRNLPLDRGTYASFDIAAMKIRLEAFRK